MLRARQISAGAPLAGYGHTAVGGLSAGGFHRSHVDSGFEWTFRAIVAFDVWVEHVVILVQQRSELRSNIIRK